MSKLVALTRQTHDSLRWRRPSDFRFAASDHLTPLGLEEMQRAAMALPVGFIKLQEGWLLIAIQGLRNGENLVVDGSGKWLAGHLPNAYSGFPFHMVRADPERYQLCVSGESEFVQDVGEVPTGDDQWRPFFDDEGEPAGLLKKLVEKMRKHTTDLLAAERVTMKLAEMELLRDWNITFGNESAPKRVKGLYTIDHQRLAGLDGEAMVTLRDCGALYAIYLQLQSRQHLPLLVEIARRRWMRSEDRELDFGEAGDSGNISFENL